MVYITRTESFSAAHKLERKEWSKEKNEQVFGKCANTNWHGHNYTLSVTIKGTPNVETGFVINLSDLAEIIKRKIITKVDHKNLNLDVDFMKGSMASTEILAVKIWEEIQAEINQLNCILHCVKIQETEKNFVEYFGA